MRINKFIAAATGLSRRAADRAIKEGRVKLNGRPAKLADEVSSSDKLSLDNNLLTSNETGLTIMLNKPAGYVCSRSGQGSLTVYDLLPASYSRLKPVGRLDKASTGLLLLTDDGDLANRLTHPSHGKVKVYEVKLDRLLQETDRHMIVSAKVRLSDGPSGFHLEPLGSQRKAWQVTMRQGRNRQIRRTFAALGYEVKALHRIRFGDYDLAGLSSGQYRTIGV